LTPGDLFALLDDAGLDPDPLQVAEAIWLAQFAAPPADAGSGQDDRSAGQPGQRAPIRLATTGPGGAGPAPAAGPRLPLYLPGPAGAPGATAAHPGLRSRTVRVPGMTALPGGQGLLRALRPLRLPAPDPLRRVLDEEATADAAAQSGIVVPVLRDGHERALSLTLVVDSGPAMAVWSKLETELLVLLHQLGAFRDLQKWYLRTTGAGTLAVSRTAPGAVKEAGRAAGWRSALRDPAELADPSRQRVILFLTDAASSSWYDGAVTPVLRRWASWGPLAILQPLPQQLWARTGLSPVQGRISSSAAAAPNAKLRFRVHQRTSRPFYPGSAGLGHPAANTGGDVGLVPVPILGLGPEWLADWASFVASQAGGDLDCTVALARDAPPARLPPPIKEAADATERVRRFAEQASPEALQLAIYLSATELSLPVIRHVQAAMMPTTHPSHLAEVLLGGLLSSTDSARNPAAPEEWRYEFSPGVREVLFEGLGRSQARRVVYLVSEQLSARFGLGADEFTAALGAPTGTAEPSLPMSVKPFAEIARQVLERVDGRFTEERRPAGQPIPATTSPLERAALLIRRYERAGKVSDLDEAIDVLRGDLAAMAAAETDQPGPGDIVELARALQLRYLATGRRADLDEAAEILDDATAGTPPGDQRAPLLAEQSTVYALRYALTGDLTDLDDAIAAAHGAIADSPSEAEPARVARYASALGSLLLRRGRATGSGSDADEAIRWLQEAVNGPLDGAERARTLTDLAAALRLRATAGASSALAADDLSAAIGALREALGLSPEGGREQAARRNALAAVHLARATNTEDASDLRTAADIYRQVGASEMVRITDRADSLAGLGRALLELARLGAPDTLPEAVRSLRAAVSQTLEEDTERPQRLAALADALLQRFELNRNRSELTEAAYLLGQAAASAPTGSEERARYLTELGLTYERRYGVARMSQDLALASDALRQAAAIHSAPNLTGIETAYARILVARTMYQEAGKVLQDVVTRLASTHGRDDPRTLAAQLELARVFAEAGMLADAVAILDELIPGQIRVHGPDSPQAHAARNLRRELTA
jgi:tetratricopeptide (TPR) repeat protein